MKLQEIVNGTLLGDAGIRGSNGKYFCYKLTAKDKLFLKWVAEVFNKVGIKTWISQDNKVSGTHSLGFYINTCPYPEFRNLYGTWYKMEGGKSKKIIPFNLELTDEALLFWYLGDGCLVRRKKDENRVPTIVLAANCFSKEDIDFLIKKLRELNLNFYPVEYTSGFTGNKCGYCLYSKTQDGTPFRFFKFIGLECPKEIANFSTGGKGIYREEHSFKNKWPTEEDWIKILSNTTGVGKLMKERRLDMGLSRKEINNELGTGKDYFRKIEYGKRRPSVKNFRKALKALNVDAFYMLKELRREG